MSTAFKKKEQHGQQFKVLIIWLILIVSEKHTFTRQQYDDNICVALL